MITISWLFSTFSVIGAFLNAYGRIEGFYIWILANLGWIVYCVCGGLYAQVPMWLVYTIISLVGIIMWKRKGVKSSK